MTERDELSRSLYRAISQHFPKGRVIKVEEIHESVLDVVLPALRNWVPSARGHLFALMACDPDKRERALDAYRDEVAHELAERLIGEAATRTPIEVYRPGLMWAAEVIDPQPGEGD